MLDETFHDIFPQGTSGNNAKLVKGMVEYFGSIDLLQYYIISYEIIDNNLADVHSSKKWAIQVYLLFLILLIKASISL